MSSVVKVPNSKLVGKWLLACAGMTAGALAVGGLVRLTGSSLSMVHFDLLRNIFPPLTRSQWEAEFDHYKEFPDYEYKLEHQSGDMSLSKFKFYYIMEYMHRMGGRLIGLAFFIPCTFFWYKGHFQSNAIKLQMVLAGALVLLQGAGGWLMVKSGLDPSHNSDPSVPRVSQYRQAMHLGNAFLLYAIFLWNGLSMALPSYNHSHLTRIVNLRMLIPVALGLVFCTAVMGSFVSGTDSGKIYNTWPKFNGSWVPDDLLPLQPTWKNFFENRATIQFTHRNLAYTTFLVVALTFFTARKMHLGSRARLALYGIAFFGCFQASSGILTLLNSVPVWLASIHQNEALGLFTCLLWLLNEIRRIPK